MRTLTHLLKRLTIGVFEQLEGVASTYFGETVATNISQGIGRITEKQVAMRDIAAGLDEEIPAKTVSGMGARLGSQSHHSIQDSPELTDLNGFIAGLQPPLKHSQMKCGHLVRVGVMRRGSSWCSVRIVCRLRGDTTHPGNAVSSEKIEDMIGAESQGVLIDDHEQGKLQAGVLKSL